MFLEVSPDPLLPPPLPLMKRCECGLAPRMYPLSRSFGGIGRAGGGGGGSNSSSTNSDMIEAAGDARVWVEIIERSLLCEN